MKSWKRVGLLLGVILSSMGCAEQELVSVPQGVPRDWYTLPEDESGSDNENGTENGAENGAENGKDKKSSLAASLTRNQNLKTGSEEHTAKLLQRILSSNERALEGVPDVPAPAIPPLAGYPADFVPWHMEAVTTDLGLTTQGLLGVLTLKGTPFASLYWRRKKYSPPLVARPPDLPRQIPVISSYEGISPDDLHGEVEPAIRAVISSGKIKNKEKFSSAVHSAIREFQQNFDTVVVPSTSMWWANSIGFDILVDAQGNVLPFFSVGGQIKIHFDWRRIKRLGSGEPSYPQAQSQALASGYRNNSRRSESSRQTLAQVHPQFKPGLKTFIESMEQALEQASLESQKEMPGFLPYNFRIGVGMTAQGTIGIAKGMTSMVGSVSFTRQVNRPPFIIPYPTASRPTMASSPRSSESFIPIIHNQPSAQHLTFAQNNSIPYSSYTHNNIEQAVYRISQERIKGGLKKALKISRFLAQQGESLKSEKWRLYEIRANFEFSILGSIAIVGVGGLVTSDLFLYNEKF